MRNFSFGDGRWMSVPHDGGNAKQADQTDREILSRFCEARRPEGATLESAEISLPIGLGTLVWTVAGERVSVNVGGALANPRSARTGRGLLASERPATDPYALLVHKARYETPKRGDTAVVFCHFSPTPYLKTLENFNSVRERLNAAGIPNFSAELVRSGREPQTRADHVFRCRSVMFHKENLWNLTAARVPERYGKLVFLDSDVLFSEPDWLDRCSALLDEFDIAQPMEICTMSPARTQKKSMASVIHSGDHSLTSLTRHHAGYALAARRCWLDSVGGVYDKAVMGGGDALFWQCVVRAFKPGHSVSSTPDASGKLLKYDGICDYEERVLARPPRVGFLEGVTAVHIPHGDYNYRNYVCRLDPFSARELSSIEKNREGVYEWAEADSARKAEAYFASRKEDGTEETSVRVGLAAAGVDSKSVPVWCVSLARAAERREYMEREWSRARGVGLKFFDAFDKRDNIVFENGADGGVLPYSAHAAFDLIGRELSQGERACRLSHFLCAERMLLENPDAPFYVVCEDDAEPLFADEADMFRRMACGMSEHEGVDVLICHDMWVSIEVEKEGLFSNILRMSPETNGPYGTVCMAFSRRGLEGYMKALERPMVADGWRYWGEEYKIACLSTNLVRHMADTTYIGNYFADGSRRCRRREGM